MYQLGGKIIMQVEDKLDKVIANQRRDIIFYTFKLLERIIFLSQILCYLQD